MGQLNEIARMQELAGINQDFNYENIWKECLNEAENGNWMNYFDESIPKLQQTYFKKVNSYAKKIFENKTGFSYNILNEIKIKIEK